AGDDVNAAPAGGQVEREIGQDLAGGGMVGIEILVEKDDPLHRTATVTTCAPRSLRSPAAAANRVDTTGRRAAAASSAFAAGSGRRSPETTLRTVSNRMRRSSRGEAWPIYQASSPAFSAGDSSTPPLT